MPFFALRDHVLNIKLQKLDEKKFGPGSFYILGATNNDEKFTKKYHKHANFSNFFSGICWQCKDEKDGTPIAKYLEISQYDMKNLIPNYFYHRVQHKYLTDEIHRNIYLFLK